MASSSWAPCGKKRVFCLSFQLLFFSLTLTASYSSQKDGHASSASARIHLLLFSTNPLNSRFFFPLWYVNRFFLAFILIWSFISCLVQMTPESTQHPPPSLLNFVFSLVIAFTKMASRMITSQPGIIHPPPLQAFSLAKPTTLPTPGTTHSPYPLRYPQPLPTAVTEFLFLPLHALCS